MSESRKRKSLIPETVDDFSCQQKDMENSSDAQKMGFDKEKDLKIRVRKKLSEFEYGWKNLKQKFKEDEERLFMPSSSEKEEELREDYKEILEKFQKAADLTERNDEMIKEQEGRLVVLQYLHKDLVELRQKLKQVSERKLRQEANGNDPEGILPDIFDS